MKKNRPTFYMQDAAQFKYLAINGQIYRNTAAPHDAPMLMKIYPHIDPCVLRDATKSRR